MTRTNRYETACIRKTSCCLKNKSTLREKPQASLSSFLSSSQLHWIGLADLAEEGRWVWQHSLAEPEFTFWDPGEPNSGQGDREEDCAHLVKENAA